MATTGDTQPSQKTFRFFDLHRELRDITYEELKCAVPVSEFFETVTRVACSGVD